MMKRQMFLITPFILLAMETNLRWSTTTELEWIDGRSKLHTVSLRNLPHARFSDVVKSHIIRSSFQSLEHNVQSWEHERSSKEVVYKFHTGRSQCPMIWRPKKDMSSAFSLNLKLLVAVYFITANATFCFLLYQKLRSMTSWLHAMLRCWIHRWKRFWHENNSHHHTPRPLWFSRFHISISPYSHCAVPSAWPYARAIS